MVGKKRVDKTASLNGPLKRGDVVWHKADHRRMVVLVGDTPVEHGLGEHGLGVQKKVLCRFVEGDGSYQTLSFFTDELVVA